MRALQAGDRISRTSRHLISLDNSRIVHSGQNTGFGSRMHQVAGLSAIQKGLRIGTEVDMDSHSSDARALIWTGYFVAAIAVIGVIAYYVLV